MLEVDSPTILAALALESRLCPLSRGIGGVAQRGVVIAVASSEPCAEPKERSSKRRGGNDTNHEVHAPILRRR